MEKVYSFKAKVLKNPGLEAYYIEFPYDVKKEFGKGRVKVKCEFNDTPYRGLLIKMKTECHIVGLNKSVREAAGIKGGDIINVKIQEDTEERIVEVPEFFRKILTDKKLSGTFDSMSFTDRKEMILSITTAKKEETRTRRIDKGITALMKRKK